MRILLVEDDELLRSEIADFLETDMGQQVTQCGTVQEAITALEREPAPLVLTDIRMPGMDGLELLKFIKDGPSGSSTEVVLISAHGDMNLAIQALRAGARDFFPKPIKVEELAGLIRRIIDQQAVEEACRAEVAERVRTEGPRNGARRRETGSRGEELERAYNAIEGLEHLVVRSDAMLEVISLAERFHQDPAVPVLITGETGTGKELVARIIHCGRENRGGESPFISLNCSAISPHLFESELFGYEGGAFTGANQKGSLGKLELARGGTIMLDEIGDLPLEQQPKLLRALHEREFYRVGGLRKIRLEARIICATNLDLERMVQQGTFRRDLFHRLNLGRIHLPSLRQRKEAISPLAYRFLELHSSRKGRRFRLISPQALAMLQRHSWPGNVRELENVIERVVLLYDEEEVQTGHLEFLSAGTEEQRGPEGQVLKPGQLVLPSESLDLEELNAEIIRKTLKRFDGNQSEAARYLNITRSAMRTWLKKIY